ncbi:uncharacterized protein LY89DRAFT_442097 [Mollisia scopiformis]|uniref:Secreted protein n=1 Tax=Mollisia scopiformis TaxID=149040 RepID=A0A194XJP9_MOLSC|nr:uncharacterized protein LY89DRAFT_442097 [Mollisia scopiformis]KUJ20383.1 hypothetical protein LY89DRAFT_442097 [Mollisia scopiformis]
MSLLSAMMMKMVMIWCVGLGGDRVALFHAPARHFSCETSHSAPSFPDNFASQSARDSRKCIIHPSSGLIMSCLSIKS